MAKNTIKLKKYVDTIEEWAANAAITPGHLLELMSTNKVKKHATAAGNALPKLFALENELEGKSIDDDYAAADRVQVWVTRPGDVVYAILKDGENVSIGDPLESAGDGTLRKCLPDYSTSLMTLYYNQIVGIAYEALDLSGSSGEESTNRLAVMIV